MKDFNEVGLKKVGVGAKVLCDRVAFDCSFDIVSQRYHAGIVGGLVWRFVRRSESEWKL